MTFRTKLSLLTGSLALAFMMAAAPAQAQGTTHNRRPGTTHVEKGNPGPTRQRRSGGEIASPAESYILIDSTTGHVLDEKNADALHHPASTTKIMTLLCVWDAIRNGRLSLDSEITISRYAASQENSALDRSLKAGTKITVRDAIELVAVASSNDLSVALAEAVAGTEHDFANVMNHRAAAIGMTRSHFVNASGLSDERQVTTATDMARLINTILTDYNDLAPFFAQKTVTYNGVPYDNHNHLVSSDDPYDGMDFGKTGYFSHAGWSLAASAEREGKRILAVILKAPTALQRDNEMRMLLDKAFNVLTAARPVENKPEPHV